MKIENDIVIFEAADFDGLSEYARKSLLAYHEDYRTYFSSKINREIELAKGHLVALTEADPRIDSILTGLASADEAKLLEAEPLLVKLNEVLNS